MQEQGCQNKKTVLDALLKRLNAMYFFIKNRFNQFFFTFRGYISYLIDAIPSLFMMLPFIAFFAFILPEFFKRSIRENALLTFFAAGGGFLRYRMP